MSVLHGDVKAAHDDWKATNRTVTPLDVSAVMYDDPCSGCGTDFTPGDLAMWSSDAVSQFCFSCVAQAYEAMRAAGGTVTP